VRGTCANGGGESSILRWGKVPPLWRPERVAPATIVMSSPSEGRENGPAVRRPHRPATDRRGDRSVLRTALAVGDDPRPHRVGLFGAWILLTLVSVALFDREAILTRWR
jgi:hypothetical protein